ncbi:MAG TPA: fluoride efflux transporter CrcB [Nevskiaceae bacterium]|nr:fluoride efflux transporter CrcB [Nevskiaceae bacterium]
MNLPLWLAVALGGAAGSLLRWQVSVWLRSAWPAFPWGTLLVNVSGGFLMGFVAAWCVARPVPDWMRIGMMTGIMGGYTTFSAFSLDTLELWRQGAAPALMNIAANLLLSLGACALGLWAARAI